MKYCGTCRRWYRSLAEMWERGFFLTIGVFDDHALAEFTDGNKRPRVQAETAPLAIVKAALEALNES